MESKAVLLSRESAAQMQDWKGSDFVYSAGSFEQLSRSCVQVRSRTSTLRTKRNSPTVSAQS